MNKMCSLKLLLSIVVTLTSGFVIKNPYNNNVKPVTENTAHTPATAQKAHESWFYEADNVWNIGDKFCKYQPNSIWCRKSSKTTTPASTNKFTGIINSGSSQIERDDDDRKTNNSPKTPTIMSIKNTVFVTDTTLASVVTVKPFKVTLAPSNTNKLTDKFTLEYETEPYSTLQSTIYTTDTPLTTSISNNQTTNKHLLEVISKRKAETTILPMETTKFFVVGPLSTNADITTSENPLNNTPQPPKTKPQVLIPEVLKGSSIMTTFDISGINENSDTSTEISKVSSIATFVSDGQTTNKSLLENTKKFEMETTFLSIETTEIPVISSTFTNEDEITTETSLIDITTNTPENSDALLFSSNVTSVIYDSTTDTSFLSIKPTEFSMISTTKSSMRTENPIEKIIFSVGKNNEYDDNNFNNLNDDDLWNEIFLYAQALYTYLNIEKWFHKFRSVFTKYN